MLTPTILFPEVVERSPYPDQPGPTEAEIIHVLTDLTAPRCVLLLDSSPKSGNEVGTVSLLLAQYRQSLEAQNAFSPKFREYGLKTLKLLETRKQLVRVPMTAVSDSSGCVATYHRCQVAWHLAQDRRLGGAHLLLASACLSCMASENDRSDCPRVPVFDAIEYVEHFKQKLHRVEPSFIADGTKTLSNFAQTVLQPMLYYSKHVKLVDRYIARSIYDRNLGNVGTRIEPGYEHFLTALVSVFARCAGELSLGSACRQLEIYTGMPGGGLPESEKRRARALFQDFEQRLNGEVTEVFRQRQFSSPIPRISVILKSETPTELPHDRVLLTDQLALQVGRGFDLLKPSSGTDPLLKDTTLTLLSNGATYEQCARALPTL